MHIRTWCYAEVCLFLPITLPAQKEHKYLDHALPEAWQENDSDFQQTLPVDDQWWKNFNDPTLDSLIEVAVKQNYSILMAADRIAMAKANLRIQQGSYSPTLGLAAGWTRQQSSGHTSRSLVGSEMCIRDSCNRKWKWSKRTACRNRRSSRSLKKGTKQGLSQN